MEGKSLYLSACGVVVAKVTIGGSGAKCSGTRRIIKIEIRYQRKWWTGNSLLARFNSRHHFVAVDLISARAPFCTLLFGNRCKCVPIVWSHMCSWHIRSSGNWYAFAKSNRASLTQSRVICVPAAWGATEKRARETKFLNETIWACCTIRDRSYVK